jgi:hypothetical protein
LNENQKNETFINLLASLAACMGEPIGANQDNVCELLLDDEEGYPHLMVDIEEEDGKYMCVYHNEPEEGKELKIDINDLYDHFKKEPRLYNYMVALIDLSAIMCMDRNTTGIKTLEIKYNQRFCVDQLQNDRL